MTITSSNCILGNHEACGLNYSQCSCLCHQSDAAITTEYYRRVRAKKATSVASGGPKGGWPKGKPRKPKLAAF